MRVCGRTLKRMSKKTAAYHDGWKNGLFFSGADTPKSILAMVELLMYCSIPFACAAWYTVRQSNRNYETMVRSANATEESVRAKLDDLTFNMLNQQIEFENRLTGSMSAQTQECNNALMLLQQSAGRALAVIHESNMTLGRNQTMLSDMLLKHEHIDRTDADTRERHNHFISGEQQRAEKLEALAQELEYERVHGPAHPLPDGQGNDRVHGHTIQSPPPNWPDESIIGAPSEDENIFVEPDSPDF